MLRADPLPHFRDCERRHVQFGLLRGAEIEGRVFEYRVQVSFAASGRPKKASAPAGLLRREKLRSARAQQNFGVQRCEPFSGSQIREMKCKTIFLLPKFTTPAAEVPRTQRLAAERQPDRCQDVEFYHRLVTE